MNEPDAPARERLTLREWQSCGPDEVTLLRGRSFDDDPAGRRVAETLTRSGRLEVRELRRGLSFSTSSWVGRLRLGPLELTILPKLEGAPFLALLRYAYGLGDLSLFDLTDAMTVPDAWPDLLVAQLAAEAANLLDSGLHRAYVRRAEELTSPRGRLDLDALVRRGPAALTLASIPCVHHPRSEDVLLNRVLRAGLLLAARLTTDRGLAVTLRRLAARLGNSITPARLDATTFASVERTRSRLTARYAPVLDLIRLLADAHGLEDLEHGGADQPLPGFLFDMNRLFQAVLTRYLSEHLPADVSVESEHRLTGVFRYAVGHNPRGRSAPTPRPDLAIRDRRRGRVIAFLDAKYRDLWERSLPSSMLYQLAIYALSIGQREAAILYPTTSSLAREAAVDVIDPVGQGTLARVILRPVDLLALAELVGSRANPRAARTLATHLAFGANVQAKLSG